MAALEYVVGDLRVDHSGLCSSIKVLSAATFKKEVVTLRMAWNWGVKMGRVPGRLPYDGLRYPTIDEKPSFQTREENERQTAAGAEARRSEGAIAVTALQDRAATGRGR